MSNTTTTVKKTRGRPAKAKATSRPTRIPMSGQRMRMHIEEEDKDPNFHYSWINDQSGLVQRAIKAGYEHVTTNEMPSWGEGGVDASESNSSMVSMNVGGDVIAYLMKQPIEFFNEDRQMEEDINKARLADIQKELNSGEEGTYGKVEFA